MVAIRSREMAAVESGVAAVVRSAVPPGLHLDHGVVDAVAVEQGEVRVRIERLGTEHAGSAPRACASSSMAITGLKPVCHPTARRPSSRQICSASAIW